MADPEFLGVLRVEPRVKEMADNSEITVAEYVTFLNRMEGFPWNTNSPEGGPDGKLSQEMSGMNPTVSLVQTFPKVPKEMYDKLSKEAQGAISVLIEQARKHVRCTTAYWRRQNVSTLLLWRPVRRD